MTEEFLRGFWIIWLIVGILFGLLGLMAPRIRGIGLSALLTLAFVVWAPAEQIGLMGQIVLFIVLSISLMILDKSLTDKLGDMAREAALKNEQAEAKRVTALDGGVVPELKADKPVGFGAEDL